MQNMVSAGRYTSSSILHLSTQAKNKVKVRGITHAGSIKGTPLSTLPANKKEGVSQEQRLY
jgi:hypothetical protein